MRPVCLIIRDGWGYNENDEANAVSLAKTPVNDRLKDEHPWTLLECSGEAVGLPEGFQGSSEVGHLNMGAGRIVVQELKRIDDDLSNGTLFQMEAWTTFVSDWKDREGTLHLFGLLQDEGVHAHQEHLFKIMRQARAEYPGGRIAIHPFLDGRDTPPRSAEEYLGKLNEVIAEIGNCAIGTVMGRYYAMDRARNWALTDKAFDCIVSAEGRPAPSAMDALKESYEQDRTPDGDEMVDEYILPYVIGDFSGVKDGDCVFHTNYRQDRAIQLTQAFVEDDYEGERSVRPEVGYLGFTRYYDEFENYLMAPMDKGGGMNNLLGEVIARAGCKQLRIAETQKFRHVTSFFNGKATTPFEGEEQIDVPSRFDASSFASHPEMEAENVTDKLLEKLDETGYAFIAVNYANCDMVGHTGQIKAAKTAVETVDACTGRLIEKLLEMDAHILVTADHGNSEQMVDYETHLTKTSHTLNPVEFIYVAKDSAGKKLLERGKLSDIAPTVLKLLGLEVPAEMTADCLIENC